jgi:hypothetical protein
MSEDGLIESGSVPGGIFGCHKQNVSPTGDAFSYFVSGGQGRDLTPVGAALQPAFRWAED